MTARLRRGERWSTDHLSPLLRFLRRSVGRPWDRVHAEIRAVADPRSLRGHHLLSHVAKAVTPWSSHRTRPATKGFFVDRHGTLRAVTPLRKPAPPTDPNVRTVSPSQELRRLDGVWYEVRLAVVTNADVGRRDVVTRRPIGSGSPLRFVGWRPGGRALEPRAEGCLYEEERLWATSKRQLGKKELRERGLRSR
jgi:hypothetical protein